MLQAKKCQFILNKSQRCFSVLSSKELSKLKPNQVSEDGSTEIYTSKQQPEVQKKPLSTRLKENESEKWKKIKLKAYKRVEPPTQVEVATLAHDLQRVLFSPGVHPLKDPRTEHYNFSPYLENITQPLDFDYDALQPYITSSKDNSLVELARSLKKRYVGSTSSVSAALSHFYFVMSNFMPVNTAVLSRAFDEQPTQLTRGSRSPASIYLRWKGDGVYAIDADKSLDLNETILSIMGKSLEKLLTLEPADYEKYLKKNSSQITEEEKNQPESYAFGELGKLLLRSQLDCHDARLPRKTFDLKTRAVIPVRLDVNNYSNYLGYSLKKSQGLYESFEREYYDMIRSAFLKYSFQVRIGHMDGILVAYHNTRNIFGFQYIPREEMDRRLFRSSRVGDRVFTNALVMFQEVLDTATKKYPDQTLRVSFDTKRGTKSNAFTRIYVEPINENSEDENPMEPSDQITLYNLFTRSYVNGVEVEGPLDFKVPSKDQWSTHYRIAKDEEFDENDVKRLFRSMRKYQAMIYSPMNKKNPLLKMFERISENNLNKEKKVVVKKEEPNISTEDLLKKLEEVGNAEEKEKERLERQSLYATCKTKEEHLIDLFEKTPHMADVK